MANITYIRIDDEVYALHDDNALTSDSNLDASKVVGTLPANTYTNTTYESKAAVQGGTDVSLVTTGDKYRWNNASSGGVSDVEVNGSSVVSGGVAEITVPTKTSDLTNDSNFQNATQVDTAINTRIASVYKAKGSVAFLDLPALTSSNEGFVYDINESFTTTSDFVEGAGKTYPAGTNVVIIDTGSGVYKYDVLAGLVDLSGKQDTLISGTNIKTINGNSVLGSGNISIPTGLQNLVDGSATGSVRGINAASEDSSYTIGQNAFAEGYNTKASGLRAHAEGNGTTASGQYSHAQNNNTIAAKNNQTAIGKYNIKDKETTANKQKAFIIGNGIDEDTRSNAFTVDWGGNTKASGNITDGSGNVLSDKADSTDLANYLPLTGGTMIGQLKTSFNGAVGMGSYGSAQTTIDDLVEEIRFSSGCAGSVSINTSYTKNGVTIPTGWYNYMYMPHRSGGKNGEADGDNQNYGNLLLFGMDNTNGRFVIRVVAAIVEEVVRLLTTKELPDEPTTPTISVTNITTGSLETIRGKLYGKHMHLVLAIKNSAAIAAGSNIFVGTVSQTKYRPKDVAMGVGYYGGAAAIVQISAAGNITVRVVGASVPANSVIWTSISFLIP